MSSPSFQRNYAKFHVIYFSGGDPLPQHENSGTCRCFSFPTMMPLPRVPHRSRLAGALTRSVSVNRDLHGSRPLAYSNSKVESILRCSSQTLPWLGGLGHLSPISIGLRHNFLASSGLLRLYTMGDAGDFHLPFHLRYI